jgi:hypothetical protein
MATRRSCSSCRLLKCFRNGMKIELIRSSTKQTRRRKETRPRQWLILIDASHPWIPRSFDSSSLNNEQSILLFNVAHCFDEHSSYSSVEDFIFSQTRLPSKLRYRAAPVGAFLSSILARARSLYERNGDFLSLDHVDRSVLLHRTHMHVAALSTHVIMRRSGLMDQNAFYQAHHQLFGSHATILAHRIYVHIDDDPIVMKLILAILAFSTTTTSVYSSCAQDSLLNVLAILRIQDKHRTPLAILYLSIQ